VRQRSWESAGQRSARAQDALRWRWRPRRRGRLARPLERSFEEVAGTGTIYSYIVVHHASVPAFAHLVPYVIALVELDEGPRLPGILLGERGLGVAIGQEVRAELTAFPGAAERAVTFRQAASA
jgi:uncharacterized OB-fold protein